MNNREKFLIFIIIAAILSFFAGYYIVPTLSEHGKSIISKIGVFTSSIALLAYLLIPKNRKKDETN